MSVSFDHQKIEKLKQLEATLALLQSPENYTRLLHEVQHTLRQIEAVVQRYDSVEAANKHLSEAKRVLDQARASADEIQQELATVKSEFENYKKVKQADLDSKEVAVIQGAAANKAMAMKLEKDASAIKTDRAEFEAMKARILDEINVKQVDLKAREAEVAERISKFKDLMGQ